MFENVLDTNTKRLLKKLAPDNLPNDSYLGGGTAVALHLGHRRSEDLDFFTPSDFIEEQWEQKLERELGFKLVKRDWQTLIGVVNPVRFSLFHYKYKIIAPKEKIYKTWVASLPDLSAMKLNAIISRGTKRDFVDIYFLAQKFGLEALFGYFQKKYGKLGDKKLMIKKTLVYFEEANEDEMPDMLIPCVWETVKNWLREEVRRLKRSG